MADILHLRTQVEERCAAHLENVQVAFNELTLTVKPESLLTVSAILRDTPEFDFKLLVDVTAVDYLHYGLDDWETQEATETGFSRGVTGLKADPESVHDLPYRFSIVYHLLSVTRNQRVRLHVNIPATSDTLVDSVIDIWPAADWFEREVFDLFGIIFRGHPDLRRILTDYGFVGHPFRKDFPLIGRVEARYDQGLKRVVYEPVSIEARVLEPKVIRHDNRYLMPHKENSDGK